MKKQFNKIALAAVTAIAVVGGSAPTWAATASADIEAIAGIQPLVSLECTPINFGVWRVPVRASGGITSVLVPPVLGSTATLSGNVASVAASAKAGHAATPGVCTFTGSSAPDGTTLALTTQLGMADMAGDASAYVGVAAPSGLIFNMTAQLTTPTGIVTTGGSSTFYVGGTLEIPSVVAATNYGGYKSADPFSITADDGI